jgi:hypothetical protein
MVIYPTQTTFVTGRHILKGVVILQETIHELYKHILPKIHFEKSYAKVKWPFLHQVMQTKGFDLKRC